MALPLPPDEDEVVDARKGRRLIFTEGMLKVTSRKRCCKRVQLEEYEIKYSNIVNTVAEWYCFSGALVITERSNDKHTFVFGKSTLMRAASALRRRTEDAVGRQKRIATKVRMLLDDNTSVGVTDLGLVTKKRSSCCKSTAVYVPWKAIVSTRMTRTCFSGTVTVNTKVNDGVQGDDMEPGQKFGIDYSQTTIKIKTYRSISEGLNELLTNIMSTNFSHMEEMPGMHIENSTGHVKATKAGLFLDSEISSCGGFVKTFIPWGGVATLAYKDQTCCKRARLLIGDRLQTPVNVGAVAFLDFEEIRNLFSKTVAELTPAEPNQPAGHGLTLNQDGLHLVHRKCCCGVRRFFVPWAKIDGLMVRPGCCGCAGAQLKLITEAGQEFMVLKTRDRKLLWEKFDEVHKWKFGTPSDRNKLDFNVDAKDSRATCVLTNQSLRLCLGKGKIKEVDLERVVGARKAKKKGVNAIEVALSLGKSNKCEKLVIPLTDDRQAEEVAKDIRDRVTDRRNYIKKTTGLVA